MTAVYLGIAGAATRLAHDRARNRTVTGASLPMAHRPEHVFGAAEIEIALRTVEAMLRDVTGRRAAGEVLAPEDLQTLKHVAVAAADSAVDRCVRMVGGHGIFRASALERHYRDVRAGQFHPPSPDTAAQTIGKAALGIDLGAAPRWPAD